MVNKIPPPPQLTGPEWQMFNRWLLEVTAVLDNEGNISPDQVAGLPAVIAQVGVNTTDIGALETSVGNQGGLITGLQQNIAALQAQITAIGARGEVLNGTADPVAGDGKVKDWYANTAGAAGHRIFVKTGVATWFAFPF